MSSYIFNEISADDPIFSTPEYDKDRLVFNYIEGIRNEHEHTLYSDGKLAIICRKKDNRAIWIWTHKDAYDNLELIISIAKKVSKMNIKKPYFFVKPQIAQVFSDMFALYTNDLDYQIKDELSLNVCKFNGIHLEEKHEVTVHRYNKKLKSQLLDFYSSFKEEFCWNDKRVQRIFEKYSKLNTYVLLKNGRIVSVAVLGNKDGKYSGVHSVATIKEERNKGYGSYITNIASHKTLKEAEGVMLYTNNSNKKSNKTFYKAGFDLVGKIHLIKS